MSRSAALPTLVLEPIPENLFREPIEYIFADHYRQRVMLNAFGEFLNHGYFRRQHDDAERAELTAIVSYLDNDFPLHIADEDDGLFAVLRERCQGDASCKAILRQLADEHADEAAGVAGLADGLRLVLAGRPVANSMQFMQRALRFVETQRRHLLWENNVVLPLARERLDAADLERIGRTMAARRGTGYPGDTGTPGAGEPGQA